MYYISQCVCSDTILNVGTNDHVYNEKIPMLMTTDSSMPLMYITRYDFMLCNKVLLMVRLCMVLSPSGVFHNKKAYVNTFMC